MGRWVLQPVEEPWVFDLHGIVESMFFFMCLVIFDPSCLGEDSCFKTYIYESVYVYIYIYMSVYRHGHRSLECAV